MLKELKAYRDEVYPFHMPGHKLGRLQPIPPMDFYDIDVTEVNGTDNLHSPEGIILEAQKRASELYGTRETYFLVNGSSSGLLSAISALCVPDGKILIARNSHKSVYHGVYQNRLTPIYVYPKLHEKHNILLGVSPQDIEELLQENPEISLVVITSPTFDGVVSDISSIARVVHGHGKLLVVDEAHGAHFHFHEYFPESAVNLGADVVIQSIHKTLPALTQSSLLHICSDRVNLQRISFQLAIYQSTSPSYILMAAIDGCITYLKEQGEEAFREYVSRLSRFRSKVSGLKNIKLFDSGYLNSKGDTLDPSKLLFLLDENANGKQIEWILRDQYKIQMEMSGRSSFLALSSVADTEEGFDRLYQALVDIDGNISQLNLESLPPQSLKENTMIYTPFQALMKEGKSCPLEVAPGKISGQFVTLYPPGIPILVPGEVIEAEHVRMIQKYLQLGYSILEINEDSIHIIE